MVRPHSRNSGEEMRQYRAKPKNGIPEIKPDNTVGQILFVYGGHCVIEGVHFIITKDADCELQEDAYRINGMVEVIPESVGQDTGLKDVGLYHEGKFDSDGNTIGRKDIYSHDILEVVSSNVVADGYKSCGGGGRLNGERFVVTTTKAGFTLVPISNFKLSDEPYTPNRHGFVNNYNFWNAASNSLKVIGNTTDNPKMLETI